MDNNKANWHTCKKCSTRKLRVAVGRYPGGDPKYQNEKGEHYNGNECSDCYKLRLKLHMRKKRNEGTN